MLAASLGCAGSQGPPSPTLTNPDMILPDHCRNTTELPFPQSESPPSPSDLVRKLKSQTAPVKLSAAPPRNQVYRRTSSSSRRAPFDTLPHIQEVETPRKSNSYQCALVSSPTLRDMPLETSKDGYNLEEVKRWSAVSGSVYSEDLENFNWPGFDAESGADTASIALEHEDGEDDHLPVENGEQADGEHWPFRTPEGDEVEDEEEDENLYSSSALSRRAEMILANAKKRLNLMEGNLRGARSSLMVAPSPSLKDIRSAAELSSQKSVAQDCDRLSHGRSSFFGGGQGHSQLSRSFSVGSSGHVRNLSESHVPSPINTEVASRTHLSGARSASALGSFGRVMSPMENSSFSRPYSVRGSRSQEAMRVSRQDSWGSLRKPSVSAMASPTGLEPLMEDDRPAYDGLHRSASTTGDLRAHMEELKGRISSLKQRAREDGMRRRSLQSLRESSPFTDAEAWQYRGEGNNARIVSDSVERELENSHLEDDRTNMPEANGPLRAQEGLGEHPVSGNEYTDSHYEDAMDDLDNTEPYSAVSVEKFLPAADGYHDRDGDSHLDDESVYEEADDGGNAQPFTERHEDRADAFDYENFFLHSAMGSFNQGGRRLSTSSTDSVETTKPASPARRSDAQPINGTGRSISATHHRNQSVDSISTLATFATATEGLHSDNELDKDPARPQHASFFSMHGQTHSGGLDPTTDLERADSAIIMQEDSTSSDEKPTPRGSMIINGIHVKQRPASVMISALLGSVSDHPGYLSPEERQLICGLAASFEQVCLQLQGTAGDQYERRLLRRRLDRAGRILDGEIES